MPAQRSNIGRRTAALSVLVVLGFGFAGPAPALQFDTFGLSAIITAPSAMTSGLTGTVIRATAYPDVVSRYSLPFFSPHQGGVRRSRSSRARTAT